MPHPTLVMGDFNTHNRSWSFESDDSRASSVQSMFDGFRLVHLNDGSLTRIAAPPRKSSVIDLNLGGGTVLSSLTRQDFLTFGEWQGGSEILVQSPPWSGIPRSGCQGLLQKLHQTLFRLDLIYLRLALTDYLVDGPTVFR
jgi:hypothetical protein